MSSKKSDIDLEDILNDDQQFSENLINLNDILSEIDNDKYQNNKNKDSQQKYQNSKKFNKSQNLLSEQNKQEQRKSISNERSKSNSFSQKSEGEISNDSMLAENQAEKMRLENILQDIGKDSCQNNMNKSLNQKINKNNMKNANSNKKSSHDFCQDIDLEDLDGEDLNQICQEIEDELIQKNEDSTKSQQKENLVKLKSNEQLSEQEKNILKQREKEINEINKKPINPLDLINEQEINPLKFAENQRNQFNNEKSHIFQFKENLSSNYLYDIFVNDNKINMDTFNPWNFKQDIRQKQFSINNSTDINLIFKYSCLAIFKNEILALGTTCSNIVILQQISQENDNLIQNQNKKNNQNKSKNFSTIITTKGKNDNYQLGQVSCLDFSEQGDYLLAGFSKGQIKMIDLNKKTVFKTWDSLHNQNVPVVEIKFISGYNFQKFISSDALGYVYLNGLEKSFFGYNIDTNPLFQQTAGPVYQIDQKQININDQNITLLALASLEYLLVVTLDPELKLIYKMPRKKITNKQGKIIYVQFNPIYQNDRKNNIMLGVSVGNIIQIYKFKNMELQQEGQLKCEINMVAIFQSDIEILHFSWISETIMSFLDVHHKYNLIEIKQFTQDQNTIQQIQSGFDENSQSNNKIQINEINSIKKFNISQNHWLTSDIVFHIYIKDQNDLIKSCFNQSVKIYENKIYFLTSNQQVHICEVETWKQKLSYLTEQKKEWLSALALSIMINENKYQQLYGLKLSEKQNQKQTKIFIELLLENYVNEIGNLIQNTNLEGQNFNNKIDSISSTNLWNTKIFTCLEFLIQHMKNFQFLFTQLSSQFKKFQVYNLFLQNLEPFILKNQLKYVSIEVFRDLINFYTKLQDKQIVIKQLVINLDPELIDSGLVMTICIEYKLFTPLIYISTHIQQDFISPIVKMFAEYKNQIQQEHTTETKNLGLKCLWYLRLTLRGQLFPNKQLDDQVYDLAIQHLFIWIFAKENLKFLINIDPYCTFQILHLFIEAYPYNVVKENEKQLKESLHSTKISEQKYLQTQLENEQKNLNYEKEFFKESNQEQIDLLSGDDTQYQVQSIFVQILQIIYESSDMDNLDVKACYMNYLAEIVLKGYHLTYDQASEAIQYLLQFPETTLQKYKSQDENQFGVQYSYVQLLIIKSQSIIKLIQQWEFKIVDNDTNYKFYLNLAKKNELVASFLLYLKKDYLGSLYKLLSSQYREIQEEIFEYSLSLFEEIRSNNISDKNQIDNIEQFFIEQVQSLVQINSQKYINLLYKINKSLEHKALIALNQYPFQQYQFVKTIIQNNRNLGISIDDKYLVIYIKLMCKFNPDKVLNEIKTFNYPLDQTLEAAKQNNIKEVTAFLYQRSGATEKSIDLYFEVFYENIDKFPFNDNMNEHEILQLQRKLNQIIYPCIDVCIQNNRFNDQDSEYNWFQVLDKLLDFQEKVSQKSSIFDSDAKNFYQNLVSDLYSEIFEKMTKYVNLLNIIEHLNQSFSKYSEQDIKRTVQRLLVNYSYEKSIMSQILHILNQDSITDGHKNFINMLKGQILPKKCNNCNIDLKYFNSEKQIYYLFVCGHVFHLQCHPNTEFCEYCFTQDQKSMIQVIQDPKEWKKMQNSIKNPIKLTNDQKNKLKKCKIINIENQNKNQEQEENQKQIKTKFQIEQEKEEERIRYLEKRERINRILKIYDYKKDNQLGPMLNKNIIKF